MRVHSKYLLYEIICILFISNAIFILYLKITYFESTWCIKRIANQCSASLIVHHLGISMVNAMCMFTVHVHVISQGARDEMFAALILIFTAANLYFYFLYPQNTSYCVERSDEPKFMTFNMKTNAPAPLAQTLKVFIIINVNLRN